MKRKLVTLHKAMRAKEAAMVISLVVAEIDSNVTMEAHGDETSLYVNDWLTSRVAPRYRPGA